MKITFYIIFTFITTLTNGQNISGKVLDLATKKPLVKAVAYLVDTSYVNDSLINETDNYYFEGVWGHKIYDKVNVDSSGNFSFSVLSSKSYTLCISHVMPYFYYGKNKTDSGYLYRDDFVHNINLKEQDKFYKVFHLMVTCPYDKTLNQSFCPKCKRSDKVLPIVFGLGLPIYDENGNIVGKSPDEYYSAGCVVDPYCNPTKHCKRCKKDF